MEELRVVITADASGVGPGVAEATAQVQASADQIATAQAKATAATKALTEAQIQLGAAAEGGSAAAAGIIAEYAAASATATAEVEALTAAQTANTASTVANTVAQEADTKVTYNRMEAMGSARIAMGAMDGSTSMMVGGLARIAAGSSVVGPLLASMVPLAIIGVGIDLVIQLGEAIYKAFDLGGEAAAEFQVKLADLAGSYRTLQDETSLEADKIEAANAKLEHVPYPNAAKEAIDEALVEADKMDSKLAGLIEKEESLLKMQGIAGSKTQQVLGITPGSKEEIQDLQQHAIWMEKAVSLEGELAESKSFTAVEQGKLNSLNEKEASYEATTKSLGGQAEKSDFIERQIQATEILVSDTEKETAAIQDQMRVRDAATKHEQLTAKPHDRGNLPEQIAEAQARLNETATTQLPIEQQIVETMDRQVEINNAKANTSKEGTAAERETLRVLENQLALAKAKAQIDALGAEQMNREFEEEYKAGLEQERRNDEAQKSSAEAYNKKRDIQISAAREATSAAIEAANIDFELTSEQIKEQEQLGTISHKVAMQRLLDAQALREKTTEGALGKEQGLFDPALGQKEAEEYTKLENQMTNETKKGAAERERITQQETLKMEQMYKKVATTFNTDFEKAFNEWATKSKTAGQAFGAMLGQMELQVIDFVAKWVLQQAEKWAMTKLLDVSGFAQQRATQSAANVAMITSDAAVAAAGTMAYWSAINPVQAPAMAAIAFAETMAYAGGAVMDTGGMMPNMGFAFNTSGSPERVLSPSQTSNFESLVNNGGTRSANLHQTNNFGGGVTKEMLEAHTNKTMAKMRAMIRPEALA